MFADLRFRPKAIFCSFRKLWHLAPLFASFAKYVNCKLLSKQLISCYLEKKFLEQASTVESAVHVHPCIHDDMIQQILLNRMPLCRQEYQLFLMNWDAQPAKIKIRFFFYSHHINYQCCTYTTSILLINIKRKILSMTPTWNLCLSLGTVIVNPADDRGAALGTDPSFLPQSCIISDTLLTLTEWCKGISAIRCGGLLPMPIERFSFKAWIENK